MKTLLLVLSCAITLFAAAPYMLAVMRGKNKPRLASWVTWSVLAGVGSVAAFGSGQLPAAILALTIGLEAAVVVALGYRHGNWAFARLDAAGLLGATLGLVSLVILRSPGIATVVVIGVGVVATMPSFLHNWRQPYDESASSHGLFVVAELIILAMANYSTFTAYAYPAYLLVQDGLLAAFILFGPHRHDGVDPYEPVPVVVKPKTGAPLAALAQTVPAAGAQVAAVLAAAAPGVAAPKDTATSSGTPVIEATVNHKPNAAGWHNCEVRVSFSARDDETGIVSCSPPVEVRTDGPGQTVTGSAVNFTGITVTAAVKLNIDQTPPILGEPLWSANPVPRGDKAVLSVPVSDHTSGVARGEYVMNSADPGHGKGTPMRLNADALVAEVDTDLAERPHLIRVRAMDVAGNWSELMPVTLNVVAKD